MNAFVKQGCPVLLAYKHLGIRATTRMLFIVKTCLPCSIHGEERLQFGLERDLHKREYVGLGC